MEHKKFPSIPHIWWSDSVQADDIKTNARLSRLQFCDEVVVTEKLDGECTTMYWDYIHARSVDSKHHESRSWVKRFHSTLDIPENMRIVGENMYAEHSISYTKLTSYFYVYAMEMEGFYTSFDTMSDLCDLIGLKTVPVLYRGPFNEKAIKAAWNGVSAFGDISEGYVIRAAGFFAEGDFEAFTAKYVRPNHVQTDEHWMDKPVKKNLLVEVK